MPMSVTKIVQHWMTRVKTKMAKLLRRGVTEVNRLAFYDTAPLLVCKERVGTTVDKLQAAVIQYLYILP